MRRTNWQFAAGGRANSTPARQAAQIGIQVFGPTIETKRNLDSEALTPPTTGNYRLANGTGKTWRIRPEISWARDASANVLGGRTVLLRSRFVAVPMRVCAARAL